MLEWAAEQGMEISRQSIDLELFLLNKSNVERGVHNLEIVLQQTLTVLMALTSHEATLSPTRGIILWRPGDDCRSATTQRQVVESAIFCSLSSLQEGALFWNSKLAHVSRNEKKLKDTLDDEIKLAGLEALVPEELDRLRTFADARLEVVTYVEPKFGLRIWDARPGDATSRGQNDPMDVDAVNSLSSGKGKMSSSPHGGSFTCGGAHFQRDCSGRKGKSRQSSGKGKSNKS